jgi:hypothetical protein
MQMIPVLSSNIEAIGYDAGNSDLYVKFHRSARTYVYRGVPIAVWQAFLASRSKGQFLAWMIKGRYRYGRVA